MSNVQILVTGRRLMGSGFRAIEPVVEELIRSARSEIHIAAYLFTGSLGAIFGLLAEALEKGVRVTMVINRIDRQPSEVRTWLVSLGEKFPHARIVDFSDAQGSDLHAKVIVADRQEAVVGSANLTWGGMVANHEIAVLLRGKDAWYLASLIETLSVKPSRV